MSEAVTVVSSDGVIDPRAFRDALGHYPTGVALITAALGDGELVGMVVGTFSSVSIDPPMVAFMPDRGSKTFARLREATSFCVNVLAADQAQLVSTWRGGESFADVSWRPSPSGAPILEDSVTWIDCDYQQIVDAGDHYIVLGGVRSLEVQRPTCPLLFFQGGFGGFASSSFLAPADHHLIRASRLSGAVMAPLETLAGEVGADVSMLALIADHDVVIGTQRGSATRSYLEIGMRLPIVPPAGSVYLDGTDEDRERWLARLPRGEATVRERCAGLAGKVAEQGYSLSLLGLGPDQDVWQDVTRYIHGEPTPRRHRQVQDMHVAHLDFYEPELVEGESYDVRSITAVVPLVGGPSMSVRLSFPPIGADADTVAHWGDRVRRCAAEVADLMHARFGADRELD